MRKWMIAALLLGCAAGHAQAAPKPDPQAREHAIAAAAPYIGDALDTPVETLFAKANGGDGFDDLRLGLALFAGRTFPAAGSDAQDEATLAALEARVTPLSDDYLAAHPGVDWQKVDWVKVLHADKDLQFVDHYLQRHSADYWLSRASRARLMRAAVVASRPSGFTDNSRPDVSANTSMWALIEPRTLMTAAACIRAVRTAAGTTYHGPRDLPVSMLLLRADIAADMEGTLSRAGTDPTEATGQDACGTQAQFDAYVAKAKAAG